MPRTTLLAFGLLASVSCGGEAEDEAKVAAEVASTGSARGECHPRECGPAPEIPTRICDDGSIGGFTGRCIEDLRYASPRRICRWEIRSCPDGVDCGPAVCPAGGSCCDASCGMCAPAGGSCADLDQVCPPGDDTADRAPGL